jgi:two-component system, sensor histidine kinase and response regulator
VNLRKAFLVVSLSLTALLMLIGLVTIGALSAFNQGIVVAKHRQESIALINEVRHEVDLLGRLVSSYVSTANPRFLIYYYDILAIREGSKPRPENLPAAYWEQVIAGAKGYVAATGGTLQPLVERTSQLGFDVGEQALVRQIHQITEKMKQTEQVAFAATQGLYDPEKLEFVSEAEPQPEFASRLLHQAPYLKLRADLAVAVEALSAVVDQRTAQTQLDIEQRLKRWIVSAIFLLIATSVVLVLSYRYLQRYLLDPLSMLHRTAQALTAKSYGERVGKVRGVDEVRALATTIDGMAAAIQADFAQRELAERALREARSRAEVATEAKSIFLANMSHEIRTPMNAILGMAFLAMKSGLPPRQHDYVSKIHAAARSLLGILNDILDFSKIEAGKVVLEETVFDIEPVVQNALFMVQQRAEGKGVELILDYALPTNFPMVMGDQLRIGQVLINLLSNAVKFTESGHVCVRVHETARENQVSSLCFRVEDTGIGMSAAQIDQLFQEFTQADGSTTRKYGGTGLGLSISKRLAQAMGGQITVESEVDRGSRFDFTLPLPIVPGGVLDVGAGPLQCQRALVVDDYPAALESMAAILRLMGCMQVDEAASGTDALACLQAAHDQGFPYDLLLLDWRMPGMSGGQLIETARQRGNLLPAKTIVVSAADIALLRAEVTHPEVCEVIQKPLLPNVLRRICVDFSGKAAGQDLTGSRTGALLGMSVLLVEDNEVNQQVASEILQGWGANVDIVCNGRLALDRLIAKGPACYSVVLMDLEMPVMSGHEATRLLRADSRFNNLPIIAMTAHAAGMASKQTADEGMNGYIAKPFEPDELLGKLRPYMGRRLQPSLPVVPATNAIVERQFMDALALLPEVDVPVLLRRFNGRVPALAHALRRFVEDSRGFVLNLKKSLAHGDLDAACGQAHTFKGLVGTFALPVLQHAAIELEAALKSGIVEPVKEIAAVDALLQPLLDKLGSLKLATSSESPLANIMEAAGFLELLRQYLREGDGEAEELWNTNRGSLSGLYTPLQLARIERAISQWNFDEALAVLAISLEDEEAA